MKKIFTFAGGSVTLAIKKPIEISADTHEEAEMLLSEHIRAYGEVESQQADAIYVDAEH